MIALIPCTFGWEKGKHRKKRNRSEGNSNGMGMNNRTNRSKSESLMEAGRRKMLMMIKQKIFILNNTLNCALCLLFARLWVCLFFFKIDIWFYMVFLALLAGSISPKQGKLGYFTPSNLTGSFFVNFIKQQCDYVKNARCSLHIFVMDQSTTYHLLTEIAEIIFISFLP